MTVTGNPPSHPERVVNGVRAQKLKKSTNPPETEAGPTCAGDDDVHLSDDFIQFHKPEAVHAAIGTETLKSVRLMRYLLRWGMRGSSEAESYHACKAQMGSISVT